jgi:hypothetical protein
VASTPNAGLLNLGFLTVLQEGNAYLGGYLVTNQWGRPLGFHLSSAVQPNRVQQMLYAATLVPYVCADLIGKALVDRAGAPVHLVVTDREPVLDLRHKIEAPVVCLAQPEDGRASAPCALQGPGSTGLLLCHSRFPNDPPAVKALLAQFDSNFDLAEPFGRIREAISEARKMGVTSRAA